MWWGGCHVSWCGLAADSDMTSNVLSNVKRKQNARDVYLTIMTFEELFKKSGKYEIYHKDKFIINCENHTTLCIINEIYSRI